MSKKQLRNRLENLFANIEEAAQLLPQSAPFSSPAWNWEADQEGNYTSCHPAVIDCLGYSASQFIGQPFTTFALASESCSALQSAVQQGVFPLELDIHFQTPSGNPVPARFSIFSRRADNGNPGGYYGYAQILRIERADPFTLPILPHTPPAADAPPHPLPKFRKKEIPAIPPKHASRSDKNLIAQPVRPARLPAVHAATITAPLRKREQEIGALEIFAQHDQHAWSEEDRLLVEEVANQLGLALENAELYAAVQQELSDRVRAEQEILRRNRDLAALNEIGQKMSRLTEQSAIFATLEQTINQLIEKPALTIAVLDKDAQTLSFPVNTRAGIPQPLTPQQISEDIFAHAIRQRKVLHLNRQDISELSFSGVTIPAPAPVGLLAVPLITSERVIGVILLQSFEPENVLNDAQVDLISAIASQVAIALENAFLFQEVNAALQALEKRERYQANVARAVATLTEFGVKGIPDVLRYLGNATECDYIYFASAREDEQGLHWIITEHWTNPHIKPGSDLVVRQPLSAALFPAWSARLKEKGWLSGSCQDFEGREREFLRQRGVNSLLILSVPGNRDIPSFIALEQTSSRTWQNDEINVLQVAADALANTYVRQDLLEQLRSSLDETETLYKISHNLALAADYPEMVRAIAGGITDEKVNRAVLVLFNQQDHLTPPDYKVAASWFSGRGTPPPANGTSLPLTVYQQLLSIEKPVFYSDIFDIGIHPTAQQALETLHVRSIAVLPLWAARKQLGALLFLSESLHYFTIREMRTFPPLVDQMATAIENMRLFEQTQDALAETEMYYRISSGIAQSAGTSDLVELVISEIMPARAERAAIFLIHADLQGNPIGYEISANMTLSGEDLWLDTREPISVLPLIKEVNNEPLIITDIDRAKIDSISLETLKTYGIRSGVFIPLFSAGILVGLLLAASSQPAQYDPEEIRLLTVASNGFAVALERQRLLKEAQRRAVELQTAAEIARDTTSVLSQDVLLSRMVKLLNDRFGYYHTAIFLVNEEQTHAVIQQASGYGAETVVASRQRIAIGSRSIIGRVTDTGNPVIVNEVNLSPIYLSNPHLPGTQSELCLPLRIADRIIGALDIQSDQPNTFHEDEVGVFQILADQIAVAIENARAYELAQQAYQEMREVDRLKSQFLANMSHELRTPLNSIIGFSRVILKGIDGPINDLQKQDLTSIYNSGQHLLSLINNVLDLSKIEAGKMELQFEEINLGDLVNSVMATAVGLVKDKPIKLRHEIQPNLPPVYADNTRIRQVLLNFISNAAKFTDAGMVTVEVKKSVSPDNKPEVMVVVTDTGQGIDERDQEKLFLPFSQVDDSPTRKTGGTGLGLSISRSFIELHHGRIGLLCSEVGKGSTFYFTLPVQQPVTTGELRLEATLTQTEKVILAVDDDAQVISLYDRFLQSSGYKVLALTQPKKAVEKAKAIKPFAITLDVMMPEMDGWQVIHALKNDPETREIPVIICSILEEEEKGFSLGAADYLVKPFLQEDLVNSVFRLNRQNRIHRILVVDDSLEDQRLIQKSLEQYKHFELYSTTNGQQTLEFLSSSQPDAIILDLFMPGMDGFQLLEKFRTDPELSQIPVIILTGADLTPEQHHQLAEFGQSMLNKSVLREKDFLNRLEQALGRIQN